MSRRLCTLLPLSTLPKTSPTTFCGDHVPPGLRCIIVHINCIWLLVRQTLLHIILPPHAIRNAPSHRPKPSAHETWAGLERASTQARPPPPGCGMHKKKKRKCSMYKKCDQSVDSPAVFCYIWCVLHSLTSFFCPFSSDTFPLPPRNRGYQAANKPQNLGLVPRV